MPETAHHPGDHGQPRFDWRNPRSARALLPGQNWHQRERESLTFGQRAADLVRNGMGSWTFVLVFVVFMALWAFVNEVFRSAWDPYPFILLNLFLSMLAGLQGAILLIAAKRQDAVSAALAQSDFDTNVAAREDVEVLLHLSHEHKKLITELREEVRALRAELPRGRD